MNHPDFSSKALTKLLASTGGAFAVFLFFVIFQYIFKQEFLCPCDPSENVWFCYSYIFLPFFIFFLITVTVDKIFVEICQRFRTLCYLLAKRILRAFTVGLLWFVTALMDGDVLVCFVTTSRNITVRNEQPACKKEPTSDDFASIKHWKAVSRVTGLALLFMVLLLWSCFSIASKDHKFFNKAAYQEHVLYKTSKFLKKNIKELAKNKAEEVGIDKLEQIKEQIGLSDKTAKNTVPAHDSENDQEQGTPDDIEKLL